MLYQEIQSFWLNRLVTFNGDILRTLPLSDEDKWFLEHIGLPCLSENDSVRFAIITEQLIVESYRHNQHVVIGSVVPTDIGIHIALGIRIADRAVISFSTKGEVKTYFVNHTLPTCILFLTKFYKNFYEKLTLYVIDWTNEAEEAKVQQRIDLLENELKRIDPYAFYHAET